MAKLLQVDFEFHGPFGEEVSNALVDLAKSINQEPGMIWKIWTESEKDKLGGGIYLFEDEATAQAYLEMHARTLTKNGRSRSTRSNLRYQCAVNDDQSRAYWRIRR